MTMDLKAREAEMRQEIGPFIEKEGFSVFEVRLFFADGQPTLRVFVDHPQGGISMEECAHLNRRLSDYLDRHPLIEGSFILEVSA